MYVMGDNMLYFVFYFDLKLSGESNLKEQSTISALKGYYENIKQYKSIKSFTFKTHYIPFGVTGFHLLLGEGGVHRG